MAQLVRGALFKLLLVRFGGAAFAGDAEFAQRIALQVRNLAVAAQQALLPLLTQLATQDPSRLRGLYVHAMKTSLLLMAVVLPMIWLAGPLGALLWDGRATAPVALLIQVLAVGGLLSTFSLPAYYDFAGRGTLCPNVLSLCILAALNASLGWALGQIWGGWGVVTAYLFSTMAGGGILVSIYHTKHQLKLKYVFSIDIVFLMGFCAAMPLVSPTRTTESPWLLLIICVSYYISLYTMRKSDLLSLGHRVSSRSQ